MSGDPRFGSGPATAGSYRARISLSWRELALLAEAVRVLIGSNHSDPAGLRRMLAKLERTARSGRVHAQARPLSGDRAVGLVKISAVGDKVPARTLSRWVASGRVGSFRVDGVDGVLVDPVEVAEVAKERGR